MQFEVVRNCQFIFYPHITKNEFIIGSLVLLTLLSWYFFKHAEGKLEHILIGIIMGGAFANVIERLLTGCVADYINFFGYFHFNVWDVLISVGLLCFVILLTNRTHF